MEKFYNLGARSRSKPFDTDSVAERFFLKVNFEKKSTDGSKSVKKPSIQKVKRSLSVKQPF